MNPRRIHQLQVVLAVSDILMITAVFIAARFYFRDIINPSEFIAFASFEVYCSLAWFLAFFVTNIYNDKDVQTYKDLLKCSLYGFFYFYSFVLIFLFQFQQFEAYGWFVALAFLGVPAALLFSRMIYLGLGWIYRLKEELGKVVIIGYNEQSKRLIHSLERRNKGKEIVGICEEIENIKELHHYPILGNITDALEVCKSYRVTEVYSGIAPEHNHKIYELIQQANEQCIHFHIIPDTSVFIKKQCYVNDVGGVPVISLRKEPLEVYANRLVKTFFDIVVSILAIVFFLSWLTPIIALLIRLETKGPIFFLQARSGRGNKRFSCIKFRSMKVNSVANDLQASKGDFRLTKVGRFLRRTNLDELPQFFNVLMGEMSVVGPRPHMLKHTKEFSKQVDQYMVRLFLKPGITGWAQVNGYRGEIDSCEKLQQRVEHDLWYLENWSLWLDFKIIFRTVVNTVAGDKNAY